MTDAQFTEFRQLQVLEGNLKDFLKHMRSGACDKCGAPIFWLMHTRTQKMVPYNADVTNHVKTCVKGEQYARDKFNSPEEVERRRAEAFAS
jgi:hypothetical protein